MAEKNNSKLTNELKEVEPENLRIKYNALAAYSNSVVTFRFTVLGLYLAAVGFILGGTPSLGKYILLCVVTFSLYIIEIRNRFLKNRLAAQSLQIEKVWGYTGNTDCEPENTYIFGIKIKNREDDYTKWKLTHSFPLDILYASIFVYALINAFFYYFLLFIH